MAGLTTKRETLKIFLKQIATKLAEKDVKCLAKGLSSEDYCGKKCLREEDSNHEDITYYAPWRLFSAAALLDRGFLNSTISWLIWTA